MDNKKGKNRKAPFIALPPSLFYCSVSFNSRTLTHTHTHTDSSMASATLSFSPTRVRTRAPALNPRLSLSFLHQSHPFRPFPLTTTNKTKTKTSSISFAYVSAPASDPSVSDPEPRIDRSGPLTEKDRALTPNPISWGLLWTLLSRHKLRLAISAFALVGCTTCTLSMPIFSGKQILKFSSSLSVWMERKEKKI